MRRALLLFILATITVIMATVNFSKTLNYLASHRVAPVSKQIEVAPPQEVYIISNNDISGDILSDLLINLDSLIIDTRPKIEIKTILNPQIEDDSYWNPITKLTRPMISFTEAPEAPQKLHIKQDLILDAIKQDFPQ